MNQEEKRRQIVWMKMVTPYLESPFDLVHNSIGHQSRSGAKSGKEDKDMGARAGRPDLEFIYSVGFVGYIEIKLEDDKVLKDNQLLFKQWCDKQEIPHYVVGYIDTFLDILDRYDVIDKDAIYAEQGGAIRMELERERAFNADKKESDRIKAKKARDKKKLEREAD